MTTEQAIEQFERARNKTLALPERIELIDAALSALYAQQKREKNEPLTLEELIQKRGGWVWIVSGDPDLTVCGWAYVGTQEVYTFWEYAPDAIIGTVQLDISDYDKTWLAYDRPPEKVAK